MIVDVQRELAAHRLTTPRQCACGERASYDEDGEYDPDWHSKHVAPALLPLIERAEKRAAAAALNDAADVADTDPDDPVMQSWELRQRAAALDPSGPDELQCTTQT